LEQKRHSRDALRRAQLGIIWVLGIDVRNNKLNKDIVAGLADEGCSHVTPNEVTKKVAARDKPLGVESKIEL
jgi:hypothetical protein